jgi:hypothetical protein
MLSITYIINDNTYNAIFLMKSTGKKIKYTHVDNMIKYSNCATSVSKSCHKWR